jgi:hypothetical protein
LLQQIGVLGPLEKVDRGNIEKMFGLFRHLVVMGGIRLVSPPQVW